MKCRPANSPLKQWQDSMVSSSELPANGIGKLSCGQGCKQPLNYDSSPTTVSGGSPSQRPVCSPHNGNEGKSRWKIRKEYSRIRPYKELNKDDNNRKLTDKLKLYVADWKHSNPDPFWHRKSGKVVLSVLMVREQDRLLFFKGMNTEISLPSGSNCAERAAISSAVSSLTGLRREHFLSIAVVDPNDELNPIDPCGVCDEWLKKIQEQSPNFTVLTYSSADCDEVIERIPLLYCDVLTLLDTPEPLLNRWECPRCHFSFNDPRSARCTCDEPRFKFKSAHKRLREDILSTISRLEGVSWLAEPRSWQAITTRISKETKVPITKVFKTLKDLRSLKFIEMLKAEFKELAANRYSSPDVLPATVYRGLIECGPIAEKDDDPFQLRSRHSSRSLSRRGSNDSNTEVEDVQGGDETGSSEECHRVPLVRQQSINLARFHVKLTPLGLDYLRHERASRARAI